jgi:DNA adenine methylase
VIEDQLRQTDDHTRPFLRWAGGKSRFVHEIVSRLPILGEGNTYYEPFLGAGAVFLAYAPEHAVLSDLNPDLVRAFTAVRDHAPDVLRKLYTFTQRDSALFYYRIRSRFNRGGGLCLQAARFIYLNQTCFNGIYRVNKKGQYNVPYGFKLAPCIPGKKALAAASDRLQKATINLMDYKVAVATAKAGDVVYLDPPYPPLNGTSFFTHYTKERFIAEDQIEVAAIATKLRDRACHVVVTNADTPEIRVLYKGWKVSEITRPRYITSSNKKHRVVELIFTSN